MAAPKTIDVIEDLRKRVQQVVHDTILPNADRLDREQEFPSENLQALADKGLNSVLLPKELNGLGMENVYSAFAAVTEEIARGCPSTALVYTMHVESTRIIYNHGNEDQWERWLKASRDGKIGTTSTSEKASGGHYWHNFSEAERVGNGYVINAEKSFTTSSGYADYYVVQTKSPNASKAEDISYFIIDGHQAGISTGEWDALGVKANHSSPITFEKVLIDERDRIGKEGDGKEIVKNGVAYLLGLGAAWTGTARGILDEVTSYATKKVHKDVNRRVTDYQVIRSQLAQAKILIDSLRAWEKNLALELDQWHASEEKKTPDELGNNLLEFKVHASEIANQVAQIAMDVAGGYGYKKGTLERLYRDARAGMVMGPSNNLAREMIGKKLVGVSSNLWEDREKK